MEERLDPALVAEISTGISRDVVAEVAPEQLIVYRAIADRYVKHPERVPQPAKAKDDALGFGMLGTEEIIIPVVLGVSGHVVQFLWKQFGESVSGVGKDIFKAWILNAWKKRKAARTASKGGSGMPASEPPPIRLTAEQLHQLRSIAVTEARNSGASADMAEKIADVLATRLAP